MVELLSKEDVAEIGDVPGTVTAINMEDLTVKVAYHAHDDGEVITSTFLRQ